MPTEDVDRYRAPLGALSRRTVTRFEILPTRRDADRAFSCGVRTFGVAARIMQPLADARTG